MLEKISLELFTTVETLVLLDSLCQVQEFLHSYHTTAKSDFWLYVAYVLLGAQLYCMHRVSQQYSLLCPKVNKGA